MKRLFFSRNLFLGIIILAACLALTGCSTPRVLDESVGVGADDNAVQCIHASADGYFTDSAVVTNRIEFPASLDLGTVTPELIAAITELAEKMGCTQ